MSSPRTSPTHQTFQADETLQPTNDPAAAELSQAVEDMLSNISNKFSGVSAELLAKMDEMSRRLDNLEATIQAGEKGKGDGKS